MDTYSTSYRLRCLPRNPGVLDSLYGLWVKAGHGLSGVFGHQASLNPSPSYASLPSHIIHCDDDIVVVPRHKKPEVIDPFCALNHLQSADLDTPYFRKEFLALKRAKLEELMGDARERLVDTDLSYAQRQSIENFLNDFECLQQAQISRVQNLPYKIPDPREDYHL